MKKKIHIIVFLTIILIGNQSFKKHLLRQSVSDNSNSKLDTVRNTDTLRTWKNRYVPFNNTNKEGKIVINICADVDGKIIAATFNKEKSTTNDSYLVEQAINAAKKSTLTFDTINNKIQCGTVTYRFKNVE